MSDGCGVVSVDRVLSSVCEPSEMTISNKNKNQLAH